MGGGVSVMTVKRQAMVHMPFHANEAHASTGHSVLRDDSSGEGVPMPSTITQESWRLPRRAWYHAACAPFNEIKTHRTQTMR